MSTRTKPCPRPIAPRRHHHGWTPERRARQATLIRRWRPWTRATGPRTQAGKTRVARNALTHGTRRAEIRLIADWLRWQHRFRLRVDAYLRARKKNPSLSLPPEALYPYPEPPCPFFTFMA